MNSNDAALRSSDHQLPSRYTVIRELGRGGMAAVYLVNDAESAGTPEMKALKIAFTPSDTTSRTAHRLEAEYDTLTAISDPRVVGVYERGLTSNGTPYFTMEAVAGESLREWIDRRKEGVWFAPKEIVAILLPVAKALEAIHNAGFLYCDLKPDNIIVLDTDEDTNVKLIDFGIAKLIPRHGSDKSLEQEALVGTTLYMSPEQIRGAQLTTQSDIYSFGVLAFQLATGTLPFGGEALFTVTASHLLGRVPEIRRLNPSIPKALQSVIYICLHKNQAERYHSFGDIIARLEKFRARQRPSFLERVWRRIAP